MLRLFMPFVRVVPSCSSAFQVPVYATGIVADPQKQYEPLKPAQMAFAAKLFVKHMLVPSKEEKVAEEDSLGKTPSTPGA
jgi:hypothetical protein